jgi:hypothetical protein
MPPFPATPAPPAAPATPPAVTRRPSEATTRDRNTKVTINIPAELIDEAKNAFWVQRGSYRSFSAWIADAVQHKIAETMTEHGLTALPPRPYEDLPPGRPVK